MKKKFWCSEGSNIIFVCRLWKISNDLMVIKEMILMQIKKTLHSRYMLLLKLDNINVKYANINQILIQFLRWGTKLKIVVEVASLSNFNYWTIKLEHWSGRWMLSGTSIRPFREFKIQSILMTKWRIKEEVYFLYFSSIDFNTVLLVLNQSEGFILPNSAEITKKMLPVKK